MEPTVTEPPLTLRELRDMLIRHADNADIKMVIEEAMKRRLTERPKGSWTGRERRIRNPYGLPQDRAGSDSRGDRTAPDHIIQTGSRQGRDAIFAIKKQILILSSQQPAHASSPHLGHSPK